MEQEELVRQSEALARSQEQLEGEKNALARMQEGEDPARANPQDAAHWAAVYRELLEFEGELLASVEARIKQSDERAVSDELAHHAKVIEIELQRLELHYAFWSERAPEA